MNQISNSMNMLKQLSYRSLETAFFAGHILGVNGNPDYSLVILPGEIEGVTWQQAEKWARSIGGEILSLSEFDLANRNVKNLFEGTYWTRDCSMIQQHDSIFRCGQWEKRSTGCPSTYSAESACAFVKQINNNVIGKRGTQYCSPKHFRYRARAGLRLKYFKEFQIWTE